MMIYYPGKADDVFFATVRSFIQPSSLGDGLGHGGTGVRSTDVVLK